MKPIRCFRCEEEFEYDSIHSYTLINYGAVSKCSFYFCKGCTEWLLRECRHYEKINEEEE